MTITSLGPGPLSFTAAYSITTPSGLDYTWLSGPLNGTATTSGTQINVLSNSDLFAPGVTYNGAITITGGGTAINVPVNFRLQGTQLTVSPLIVPISVTAGHVSLPQSVSVGPGGFTATSSPSMLWEVVSPPGSFSLPGNISVSADATALQPGVQNGIVAVQCVSDNCFDTAFAVKATINPPPTLRLNPSTLSNFSALQGGINSASQSVGVSSSDGLPLPFTVNAHFVGDTGAPPAAQQPC